MFIFKTYTGYVLVTIISWTYAEFFSGLSGMEPLLETHKIMVDNLQDYITKEQNRHSILQKYLKLFKEKHEIATMDVSKFLKDPISSFNLIKRLSVDLDIIEETIGSTSDYKEISKTNYPTSEDLIGAAQALSRLCDTYRLNVKDIADGILSGVFSYESRVYTETVTPMSASDCLVLGNTMYQWKDYKKGLSWIMEAYKKYQAEIHERHPFEVADVMEHIRYAYDKLDDVKAALKWTRKLIALRPSVFYDDMLKKYKGRLAKEEEENRINRDTLIDGIETRRTEDILSDSKCVSCSEHKLIDAETEPTPNIKYETLCRGEMEVSQKLLRRLKCLYLTENHPFLKLAPIKVEQLHLKPEVLLFHEVMSDQEIEHLKHISKSKLRRAWNARGHPVSNRISETAWLQDQDSNVVQRVSQRVSDITGLSVEWAESLQVNNYGIGGHFGPHYDTKMSEVSQGGATVFPWLGLSVFPARGAALFWWNLLPSGDRDLAVMHAGCPVLRGDKWVANKWVDGFFQELIRPCKLEYEKEGYHQVRSKKL